MPRITTGFVQQPLCTPAEVLLPCRRPYCAAMATIRRPHCTLLERHCHGVCFEHAQIMHRQSAFYVIPQHPLAMPLTCCRDACDGTALTSEICIFLGHYGMAVRMLLWCDRGLSNSMLYGLSPAKVRGDIVELSFWHWHSSIYLESFCPSIQSQPYMGLVARKPVFGVSDKGSFKPVSSATEIS